MPCMSEPPLSTLCSVFTWAVRPGLHIWLPTTDGIECQLIRWLSVQASAIQMQLKYYQTPIQQSGPAEHLHDDVCLHKKQPASEVLLSAVVNLSTCLQHQQQHRRCHQASAGLCCSMSPQKLNKRSPIKQGSAHVPVWAAFGGPPPPSGDSTPLLGLTADSQTDTAPQLLTSPRVSGPNGNLEPASPCLDVEFTNMGMRLKGTGMKVLAGVTGRLRASHLTAIMGPSGAGQQSTHCFSTHFFSTHLLKQLHAC